MCKVSWFELFFFAGRDKIIKLYTMNFFVGRHSSVGVATRYGLDGPGIEPR
jgi:hypothetical protein